MRILFQGDSITDAARDRSDPFHLGAGYADITAKLVRKAFVSGDLECINRGVGGDRSRDLKARWQEDCLALKPDILTVMIGINDVWRAFDTGDPTDTAVFEDNCRYLFTSAKAAGAKLVVLEPFLLICPPDREEWRDEMSQKIAALRRLARELADRYIPLDGLFAAASVTHEPAYWAVDGVHPSLEGNRLIARHLVEAITDLIDA